MKRFSLISLFLLTSAFLLNGSGAIAEILKSTRRLSGFSPDSSHYIYLESSQDSVSEIPKAKLQIINVATNSCIEDGCIQTEYGKEYATKPQNIAENDLLKRSSYLRQTLLLNYLKTGTRLPAIARSITPAGTETVVVPLPHKKGETLKLILHQKYIPSVLYGGKADVDKAGMKLVSVRKYSQLTVDSLDNLRDTVLKYSIRDVMLSPNRKNIVVLIDMTKTTLNGVVKTTLVQSLPI